MVLAFSNCFFSLTQGEFSSQELSPILVKLLNSIKSEGYVIFLLNSLVLSPERNELNINLKLLKNGRFELFSNFKFIPDLISNTFFVVDF